MVMLFFSEVMLRFCSSRYSSFRLSHVLLHTHTRVGSLRWLAGERGCSAALLGEDPERDHLLADLQLLPVLLLSFPLGFDGRLVSVLFAVFVRFALNDGT